MVELLFFRKISRGLETASTEGTRRRGSRLGTREAGWRRHKRILLRDREWNKGNRSVSRVQGGYEGGGRDCERAEEKEYKWMGMGGSERDGEERLGKLRRLGRVDFGVLAGLAGAAPSEL